MKKMIKIIAVVTVKVMRKMMMMIKIKKRIQKLTKFKNKTLPSEQVNKIFIGLRSLVF